MSHDRATPRGRQRFLLIDNGPCANRGCEAILRSTVAILRREFRGCRFISSPFDTVHPPDKVLLSLRGLRHHPPAGYPRPFTWRWCRMQLRKRLLGRDWSPHAFEPLLPKASAVLSLGGDTISMDYGRPRYHLDILRTAVRSGRPVILWGASVGPFPDRAEIESETAALLQELPLVLVRESLTRDYLASLGVEGNVQSMADPAFVLDSRQPGLDEELMRLLDAGCLGLNLSPLLGRYVSDAEPWQNRAVAIVQTLDQSIRMPILLVYHVSYPGNDDLAFLRDVRGSLHGPRNPIELLPAGLSAPELKWVISRCAAFLGARTHSTIAALSSGVPTLSLGYSVKSVGINTDLFGHAQWVLHVREARPEDVAARTQELLRREADVRRHLSRVLPAYQQTAWDAARSVRGVLDAAAGGR
jgi:polysaccharide pyruvyl transferase WcaK-like protein